MTDLVVSLRLFVTPPVENVVMARQLTLLERQSNWRLDDRTREIGRRGIAAARAALAAHRPAEDDQHRTAA